MDGYSGVKDASEGIWSGSMTDWSLALCRETDPELFFPQTWGESRDARKTCERCDIRIECLEFALNDSSLLGIWGGVTERERTRMRSRKRAA